MGNAPVSNGSVFGLESGATLTIKDSSAEQTGKIVTVEEHSIIGGLGGAVSELLSEKRPTPMLRIGIRDVFGESGPAKELLHKYELDAEGIYKAVKKFV